MQQIIALRFAPDEEYLDLIDRALKENLTNKQIKQAIKNWRADHHRAQCDYVEMVKFDVDKAKFNIGDVISNIGSANNDIIRI